MDWKGSRPREWPMRRFAQDFALMDRAERKKEQKELFKEEPDVPVWLKTSIAFCAGLFAVIVTLWVVFSFNKPRTIIMPELKRIVDVQLGYLRKRLASRNLQLVVDEQAEKLLAEEGYDPTYGARPLKRVIQQRIENVLASKLLNGEFGAGDSIQVDYQGKSFVFAKTTMRGGRKTDRP